MFFTLSVLWNTIKIFVIVIDFVYRSASKVDLSRRQKSQNRSFSPLTVQSRLSDCTDSFLLSPDQHDFSRSHRNTSSGLTSRTILPLTFLKSNFTIDDISHQTSQNGEYDNSTFSSFLHQLVGHDVIYVLRGRPVVISLYSSRSPRSRYIQDSNV